MYEGIREEVCRANLELNERKLVIYSWGNVSAIDRSIGVVAIKPSGVPYETLTPDQIIILDLEGRILEGELNPSSDTPTHLELYRRFADIGGVVVIFPKLSIHASILGRVSCALASATIESRYTLCSVALVS